MGLLNFGELSTALDRLHELSPPPTVRADAQGPPVRSRAAGAGRAERSPGARSPTAPIPGPRPTDTRVPRGLS